MCGMLLVGAQPASADLILLGTTDDLGAGLGDVSTILSFKPLGSGTDACAQITYGDVLASCGGDVTFNGGANNQTYTYDEIGLTAAEDFRLIFNVNESDDLVNLTSLSVYFYESDGTLVHTATYTCNGTTNPCSFAEIGSGIGGQGWVFGLDVTQAGIVNASLDPDNVIGLKATVSTAGGGFETFNLSVVTTDTPVIPEPGSLMLLGSGLLLGARRLRQRFTA